MKVNQDRRVKAGTLALALQRYENNPKFHLEEIPQEVQLEEIKKYERKAEGSQERRSRSRDKSQKQSEKQAAISIEQSEDDLLALCNSLTSRIETLKKQKYDHVVQQFEEEQRKRLAVVLKEEQKKITDKYGALRKELNITHDQQKMKVIKSLEDAKKFRTAYKTMLDELEQRRIKINSEYQTSLAQLKEQKEKVVAEWKRNSNEELFKLGFKNQ